MSLSSLTIPAAFERASHHADDAIVSCGSHATEARRCLIVLARITDRRRAYDIVDECHEGRRQADRFIKPADFKLFN